MCFFDLLFSYNVTEFLAKQAFHGNVYLVSATIILFPLCYVTLELGINYFTQAAKLELDLYKRDKSKLRKWIFLSLVSVLMALVIPVLYIATGLAGLAKTLNPVFVILLIGFTILATIVHITLIFSGTKMVAAKQQLLSISGYHSRKKTMRLTYFKLTKMVANLETLHEDYKRLVKQLNQVAGYVYEQIGLSNLLKYIQLYITQDWYHLPFGEEPSLNSSQPFTVRSNHTYLLSN